MCILGVGEGGLEHMKWWSGFTLGFVYRNYYFCLALLSTWGAWDWTWISLEQSKFPSCYSIALAPHKKEFWLSVAKYKNGGIGLFQGLHFRLYRYPKTLLPWVGFKLAALTHPALLVNSLVRTLIHTGLQCCSRSLFGSLWVPRITSIGFRGLKTASLMRKKMVPRQCPESKSC